MWWGGSSLGSSGFQKYNKTYLSNEVAHSRFLHTSSLLGNFFAWTNVALGLWNKALLPPCAPKWSHVTWEQVDACLINLFKILDCRPTANILHAIAFLQTVFCDFQRVFVGDFFICDLCLGFDLLATYLCDWFPKVLSTCENSKVDYIYDVLVTYSCESLLIRVFFEQASFDQVVDLYVSALPLINLTCSSNSTLLSLSCIDNWGKPRNNFFFCSSSSHHIDLSFT